MSASAEFGSGMLWTAVWRVPMKGKKMQDMHEPRALNEMTTLGELSVQVDDGAELGDTIPRTPSGGNFPVISAYPPHAQFRVAVIGNAIDKIAQDGDTLLCVRADVAGAEPQDGDLVVIEYPEGEDFCVAIRRLRQIGDLCEFRQESNDPAFQGAPLIQDLRQAGGKIRILGKVLLAFRGLDD